MPVMQRGDAKIYYEEFGSGYPILLFAPGSLMAKVDDWHNLAAFDATVELANDFRLIALDLRNAGRSWAPITAASGWQEGVKVLLRAGADTSLRYFRTGETALHLAVQECHEAIIAALVAGGASSSHSVCVG